MAHRRFAQLPQHPIRFNRKRDPCTSQTCTEGSCSAGKFTFKGDSCGAKGAPIVPVGHVCNQACGGGYVVGGKTQCLSVVRINRRIPAKPASPARTAKASFRLCFVRV